MTVTLFSSYFISGQINDFEKKSVRIPIKKLPKLKLPKKEKNIIQPQNIEFENKKDEKDDLEDLNNKSFSMLQTDELKSPTSIFKNKWIKEAQENGIVRVKSDKFLGIHDVDTKFVNIICRDHEFPDGDRVSITVDGVVIKPSLTLTSQFRRVDITLLEGENKVEILALNEGESSPNTAEFIIYDDQQNVISSKRWKLFKDEKAIIIFNNQKKIM